MSIINKVKNWWSSSSIVKETPVESSENQIKNLDATVTELATASAKVTTNFKMLRRDYETAVEKRDLWHNRAMEALKSGDEELSKQALAQKIEYDKDIESLTKAIADAEALDKKAKRNLKIAREKLKYSRRELSSLKARNNAFKVQSELRTILNKIQDVDFSSLEEENDVFESVGMTEEETLDEKFSAVESDKALEEEFAKLKAEVANNEADTTQD